MFHYKAWYNKGAMSHSMFQSKYLKVVENKFGYYNAFREIYLMYANNVYQIHRYTMNVRITS